MTVQENVFDASSLNILVYAQKYVLFTLEVHRTFFQIWPLYFFFSSKLTFGWLFILT